MKTLQLIGMWLLVLFMVLFYSVMLVGFLERTAKGRVPDLCEIFFVVIGGIALFYLFNVLLFGNKKSKS